MEKRRATLDLKMYPEKIQSYLKDATIYDSSSSPAAKVFFIDKEQGYFLKIANAKDLAEEAELTRYFHQKKLATKVVDFFQEDEQGYLLTEQVKGEDGTASRYLADPKHLCQVVAQELPLLHEIDPVGCPVYDHTKAYLKKARHGYEQGHFEPKRIGSSINFQTTETAFAEIKKNGHLLETNTLIHGDYCLPNIMLDNWHFTGFIDVDHAGIGDRHVDLFWAMWSLCFNLGTEHYLSDFCEAYGKDKINTEKLRVVAACEAFAD